VHGSRVTADHVGWKYVPQGLTSAQMNLPYCVATLLLDGDVFVDQFTEEKVSDPRRMALAGRVQVFEDPSITALGAMYRFRVHVGVCLRDGTQLEETVSVPRGSGAAFASNAEIIGKMQRLAMHRMEAQQVQRIIDWVMHAEQQPDAGELVRLLASAG